MSKFKNPNNKSKDIPWYICLVAHSFIQAGLVAMVTGSWVLGILELCFHSIIDYSKCVGKINFLSDQLLHIFCKAFYVMLIILVL